MRAYSSRAKDTHRKFLAIAEEMGFVDDIDLAMTDMVLEAMASGRPDPVSETLIQTMSSSWLTLRSSRSARTTSRCPTT